MAYDMAVVETAYRTAKAAGASRKIMLALFEAGIVESGFRNLNHGDRDSLGYLQQRPSQGWPNPRDVPTATRSFVNKAQAKDNPLLTPGMLAQAVQVSAFPGRYDLMYGEAARLLNQMEGKASNAGERLADAANPSEELAGAAQPAASAIMFLVAANKWVRNPDNWARVIKVVIGGGLLFIGLRVVAQPIVDPVVKGAGQVAAAVATKGKK